MKKWMIVILIGAWTAGLAVAEEKVPWYKKLFNKSADEPAQVFDPAPEVSVPAPEPVPEMPRMQRREGLNEGQRPKLTPEQVEKMKARKAQMQQREGAGDRQHPRLSPEQMEKMKAQHEALMQLGEAARNETDPVKKEALVAELRVKLTAIDDKIQQAAKKRLEQAGKEMTHLEKRIADYEQNKDARIEEQVKRILAGEPLKKPAGIGMERLGEGQIKKGPKPPVAE
jgi:hypothetical protein